MESNTEKDSKSLLSNDNEAGVVVQPEQSEKKSPGEPAVEPASEKKEENREGFSNGIEFVLTCMGFAVGLGNIWRFPTMAYENGGSAFLIPYLTCAILFGLPAIYLEFLIGQYNGVSPPVLFRRIMPILEGVGWMGPLASVCVAVYYIVIISWISLYLMNMFRGHHNMWTKCENDWNVKATCVDMIKNENCKNTTNPSFWINGSCKTADELEAANIQQMSATEQYFKYNIVDPSDGGMFDFQEINWAVLISMTLCWILTCLLILKGMKIMGKISYVTVILPYIIVIILFFRGITLDGAMDGLEYYLGTPDFSKLKLSKTWTNALKQLCFSLSVGHGGLMSMASYSDKKNNCFRDACIVVGGDTVMSLIGGAGVFSTLGFLAKKRGVSVPDVVQSGQTLAFVVYPEAMSQMTFSDLWVFLFFFMLFLLGISTEIALAEVICTCLYDQYTSLRTKKHIVAPIWCFILYLFGLIFCTRAGIYWFDMFNDYAAGFSSVVTIVVEILIIDWVYGFWNFRDDIVEIMGKPKNKITAILGPHSPYFIGNWIAISPVIGLILVGLSFDREYPYMGDSKRYPWAFDVLGWCLSFIPTLLVPVMAAVNYYKYRKRGETHQLFKLQKEHPAYLRIHSKSKSKEEAKPLLIDQKESQQTA